MECSHDPKTFLGQPIGQYHCPECGVMVLAGVGHPEICECSGYADYKGLCPICSPEWDNDFEEEGIDDPIT
jgi:hypothetical protein